MTETLSLTVKEKEERKFLLDSNNQVAIRTQDTQFNDLISTNTHTSTQELRVFEENHICPENTTSNILLANAQFVGGWQDCLNYAEVNISIDTDKNSATNGLVIQWSADGSTVADTDTFNVYANRGTNYTPNPAFRYVKVLYTNGSVAQGRFSLMTILRRKSTGGSFHRISDTLRDDSDGRLNVSVLKLRTAQDNYVSAASTNSGNFKVSLEEFASSLNTNPLPTIQGFNIPTYTSIELSYTGDNLTSVIYKNGVTTVATLTLTYTGSNLTGVTKT